MDSRILNFNAGIDIVKSIALLEGNPSNESKRRFFTELKAARFLVPCRKQDNNIIILSTPERESFLPAFTTMDELAKKMPFKEKVSILSFDDIKHIVVDNSQKLAGIVINPFGKALFLRHSQLSEINADIEGMTVKRVDHKSQLRLEATVDYPIGLPNVLRTLFKTHLEVSRAWILLAWEENKNMPHKLFVIDFHGDRKMLFPLIARVVQPFMKPGESFELIKSDFRLEQIIAQAKAKPIYSKE